MTQQSDPKFEALPRLGDNTLILGHRVSEWCGHAPVLEEDIARTSFIQGTPSTMIETAFEMEEGTWQVVSGDGQVVVLGLTDVNAPDQDSAEAQEIKTTFGARVSQQIAADVQDAFAAALEADAGVTLDQAMINAVHANFP